MADSIPFTPIPPGVYLRYPVYIPLIPGTPPGVDGLAILRDECEKVGVPNCIFKDLPTCEAATNAAYARAAEAWTENPPGNPS